MITDNILGEKDTRKFKPNRKPILLSWEEVFSRLDPEIKALKHVNIKDNPDNREYSFWSDSISQSMVIITAAMIDGSGMKISAPKQSKDFIDDFCLEINQDRESMEDYFMYTWIDEMTHGGSFYYIDLNKELPTNVGINRLDPKSLTLVRDPKNAWRLYEQNVGDYVSYNSKTSFYRNATKDNLLNTPDYKNYTNTIKIQDEPDVLLRTKMFIRPPISSALHYITYKRYILYFMRKFSQRYWTPFTLFLIGDPATNYYPEEEEMEEQMSQIEEMFPQMASFGSMTLPGNVKVQELGSNTARGSEIYVTFMDALDKQISLALFTSMGLRDSRGVQLSTDRGIKETTMQFIQNIRRRYKIRLENFFNKGLLKLNGIKVSKGDVEIEFPPLKFEASEEYMRAIEIGRKIGMFTDRNELRKAGTNVFEWLDPVAEKDNGKIDFQLPLQTSGSMFGTKPTSTSQNMATKQKQTNSTTV